jgi:hypothetical protein
MEDLRVKKEEGEQGTTETSEMGRGESSHAPDDLESAEAAYGRRLSVDDEIEPAEPARIV